jgi:hypothetical protein
MSRIAPLVFLLLLGAVISSDSLPLACAQSEDPIPAFEHEPDDEEYDEEAYQPRQESMLSWTYHALGLTYALVLPLAGFIAFVLALILVIRGGNYAGSALLLVVPIPLLIGLFGFLDGLISGYQMLATPNSVARPWELAAAMSTALMTPLVGMLLMAPAYLVAMVGLFIRTMVGERQTPKA